MLSGDWSLSVENGAINLQTDVRTSEGDKTIGFVVPQNNNLNDVMASVVGAEEDAKKMGWKFMVDTVTDPGCQVDQDALPSNVLLFPVGGRRSA